MSSKRAIWAFMALCGLSLMSVPAMAQDDDPIKVPLEKASPTPEPQASQPAPSTPTVFYLEVDQNDLAAISTALVELPKKVADPLILKLNGQLQKQAEIRAAAKKAEAEPAKKGRK